MGLNYVDSIIVYNEYKTRRDGTYYYGTRFDNVRVELTQAANITKSGLEGASVCVAKIPKPFPKPFKSPEVWLATPNEEKPESFTLNKGKDFFVVVKKEDLGVDIQDLPVGMVKSDTEEGGWFEIVKTKYGYTFMIDTVDVYTLIARLEIGGK